jgi:hypothetical protein
MLARLKLSDQMMPTKAAPTTGTDADRTDADKADADQIPPTADQPLTKAMPKIYASS